MISHLGPSHDQRFDKLPELICEAIAEQGHATIEAMCQRLERVAMILRGFGKVAEYARKNKPDPDDIADTKRAMRVAMICAFEKVDR